MRKILILMLASLFTMGPFVATPSAVEAKGSSVHVKGYTRKDGTYVAPHYRSAPDGNPYNNWSYPGNTNPYTGQTATGNPDAYLDNYYNCSSASGVYSGGTGASTITYPSTSSQGSTSGSDTLYVSSGSALTQSKSSNASLSADDPAKIAELQQQIATLLSIVNLLQIQLAAVRAGE